MPANYKPQFGEVIRELLGDLTHPEASAKTGYQISPSYWTALKAGQIPSTSRLRVLAETWPEYAARIYDTAGMRAPEDLGPKKEKPYCEAAKALAAKLGISKDEAILRAVKKMSEEITMSVM